MYAAVFISIFLMQDTLGLQWLNTSYSCLGRLWRSDTVCVKLMKKQTKVAPIKVLIIELTDDIINIMCPLLCDMLTRRVALWEFNLLQLNTMSFFSLYFFSRSLPHRNIPDIVFEPGIALDIVRIGLNIFPGWINNV